jgi:hypothetical protein
MSLQEELSLYWTRLQEGLFPRLEAMVGSLTPLYKKLVTVLELAPLETFLPDSYPFQRTAYATLPESSKAGGAAQEHRCVRLQ